MAVDVIIKSKGLLKKKLKFHDIIFENMRYGIMDEYYRLDENKYGEYTIVSNSKSICRGYEISLKKGLVELKMPLPTSENDIRFFYDYIAKICKKMKTNEFIRNEEKATFDQINSYIEDDITTSERVLKSMEDDINTGKCNNLYIFGVMNPISLGKEQLSIIDNNAKKFGEFMHNIQSKDLYYAVARAYRRKDGSFFGVYALTENVMSILPFKGNLLMSEENVKIDDWNISFVINNEVKGTISYDNFIKNVNKEKQYDQEHFIISLEKKEIEQLLDKYKIEL